MNPKDGGFSSIAPAVPIMPDIRKDVRELMEDVQDVMFRPNTVGSVVQKVTVEVSVQGRNFKLTLERV